MVMVLVAGSSFYRRYRRKLMLVMVKMMVFAGFIDAIVGDGGNRW